MGLNASLGSDGWTVSLDSLGINYQPFVLLGSTHAGGAGRSKTDANTSVGVLWSLLIPAGTIEANDTIVIRPKLTVPNSATTKTFGIRTQTGAVTIYAVSATTSASILPWVDGSMRNSLTSQIWVPSGTTGIASVSGTALATTSIDFSIDQTLEFYGQWGTAGAGANSITLESALVYLVRGV